MNDRSERQAIWDEDREVWYGLTMQEIANELQLSIEVVYEVIREAFLDYMEGAGDAA